MRLSLTKGAHVDVSRAAYRKFGVSRAFCEMWGGCVGCPNEVCETVEELLNKGSYEQVGVPHISRFSRDVGGNYRVPENNR
jgi:hypothetical protein